MSKGKIGAGTNAKLRAFFFLLACIVEAGCTPAEMLEGIVASDEDGLVVAASLLESELKIIFAVKY